MLRHEVDVDPRCSPCGKHWAVYENETVHLRAGHVCERLLDLAWISRFEGLKLNP